ncbi:MAG TPA: protein kinase [Gemmatimonadaceae bacterium]
MDALKQLQESLAERYDIKREIGAGGMATVYLAQDLRHDRPVALKLLNPELAAVLGVERFLSEIRVTANLQHPNLLPLFDSGAADGLLYYVMPFVEGESLRHRLDREKQLPVDEAIRIAVAIANALDYAHSHGVIHRDLKPENILLQANQPVIADFGIALAVSNAGGSRITQTGLSLGTPQYMSPEQATGDRVIDGRSDIYSLGALTYEMLTAEPPHTGSTSQAIIARMLTEKPRSMRATRSSIPEYVEFAVQHALEKLPADRFSTAGQFAEALRGHVTGTTTGLHQFAFGSARNTWRARLQDPVVMGSAALAVGAILFAAFRKPPAATERVTRFVVATTDSTRAGLTYPWPGAISPDGSTVVYWNTRTAGLMALRTDEVDPRPIPNSSGASQVIFSPDGQWIAYESNGKLRKSKLDGSSPSVVANGSSDNGADWTSRGEIVRGSQGASHGLQRVSENGGEEVAFLRPDTSKGEQDYLWPIASPDGKRVVFAIWKGSLASTTLASTSIDDAQTRPLGLRGIRPLAILDRTLVYVQDDGSVMAVKLNRSLDKLESVPVTVLEQVEVPANVNGNSEIFISRGGALLSSRGRRTSRLAWFSPDGSSSPASSEVRAWGAPRLSPDEKTVAAAISDQGMYSIWLYDIVTRTLSKLTSSITVTTPAWSADGQRLYFGGVATDMNFGVYVQNTDGASEPRLLVNTGKLVAGVAVSPDEKTMLLTMFSENAWKLFVADVADPKPKLFLNARGNEWTSSFSPDGKWVAMTSDEGGRDEVYIRSFPIPSARIQISAGGGEDLTWSKDGNSLYYTAGTSLVKATITRSPAMRVVARDTVIRAMNIVSTSALVSQFDITRSGKVLARVSETGDYQLIAVPNWKVELERKLAAASRH